MDLYDFFIGLFLMNAMPHFVLGVWKGRILSLFGFSPAANIAYGLLNFGVSIGLFFGRYGLKGLVEQPMFSGALLVLVLYFLLAQFLYQRWQVQGEAF
jgi:hypothetical protein